MLTHPAAGGEYAFSVFFLTYTRFFDLKDMQIR